MRRLIAGIALAGALTTTALAGPFEDAQTSTARGDYVEAFKQFLSITTRYDRVMAEANEATKLQLLHEMGDQLFHVAASYGILGTMYEAGLGTTQNYTEAAKYYLRAEDEGHLVEARMRLGVLYANGFGVRQDYTEAAKWYRLAADQGLAEAQANLSELYYFGHGVPKDYVLAYKWINLASGAGHKGADTVRDALTKLLTRDELAEAQRLSREWKPNL